MQQVAKDKVEIGLVLQGGGALGAYEYGAIEALLELMDAIDRQGKAVKLVAVTGVSIGAINAACVVGASDRTDARARLQSLWSELSQESTRYFLGIPDRDLALFGVRGFYELRRDYWNFFDWTNFYNTHPMLKTLANHVDFDRLNNSPVAFVVTAVDVSSGELIRFRNKGEPRARIEPHHVLASGSLPPAFPATMLDRASFWDGGIVDNTPLGDAIDAFSESGDVDRILVVMNLFRKKRALPSNMIEVNDRLAELRYGNRLRQDGENARTINKLLRIIDDLAAAIPEGSLDPALSDRVAGAARFKILDEITDIDLADPVLMEKAGFNLSSDNPAAFRDFSAEGIQQRHDIGYKIAQMKLQELFESHGLLPASH